MGKTLVANVVLKAIFGKNINRKITKDQIIKLLENHEVIDAKITDVIEPVLKFLTEQRIIAADNKLFYLTMEGKKKVSSFR